MSSVGCPRCEESFRVPDAPLPEGIRLRCPWCSETFRLTELSQRMLPMVELIDEDNQPIQFVENKDPFITQVVGDRMPVTGPVSPRPLLPTSSRDLGDSPITQRPRKKKKSSPMKTGVRLVLGGLAGVILAGLILQYVVGRPQDWGFWPFKQSPSIDLSAAQPRDPSNRQLQKYSEKPERSLAEDMASRSSMSDSTSVDSSSPSDNPDPQLMDSMPQGNDASANLNDTAAPVVDLDVLMTDQSTAPAADTAADADATAVVDATANTGTPVAVEIAPLPLEMPAASDETVASSVAEIEMPTAPNFNFSAPAPSVSFDPPASPQLLGAIKQADQNLNDVVNFPDPSDVKGLNRRKADLYSSLANTATFEQGVKQKEVSRLIDLVTFSGLDKEMAKAAPGWMRYGNRPNNGMLAYGKITKVASGWVLKWNGTENLQLTGLDNAPAKDGDDVVILGTIVDSNTPAIIRVVHLKLDKPNAP